jgi:hypothetical protein
MSNKSVFTIKKGLFSLFAYFFFLSTSFSQSSNELSIRGNLETTFQYLNEDSLIGANQPDSRGLINSYMNVFMTKGNFKAGARFESYLPRIQGYPNRFDGTGIGMRYIGYSNDFVDATIGSFYEQFGAGLAFRAYEDRALGYDNMMDGFRLIVRPYKGITLKGVYGQQRLSFEKGFIVHADGIVRGADAEFHLNDFIKPLKGKKLDVSFGASLVSKYQVDDNEEFILPENVGVYGGRTKLRYGKFTLDAEYVKKDNDPSADNAYIYNIGHASVINFTYSQKGFGLLLAAKSVDNMSFRSDRTKNLQDVFVNYLPSMNKTHTYNLVASLYPYATQPLGEVAFQGEIMYTTPKDKEWGKKIGGKYGTSVNINYSSAYLPMQHRSGISPNDSSRVVYKSKAFDLSDSLLWRDFNVSISRKINKKLNFVLNYYNITLNNDIAKITGDAKGLIQSHIGVLETGYKLNKTHSFRTELQGLFTKKDKGNWATAVIEYNYKSHWFVGIMDQYNFGNPVEKLRLHYLIGTVGYVKEATRITVSYGRQRAGLFCVGGVCRFVPASNGLTLSFTQSF